MTISLREPGALHHMKTGEDHGKNHSLPPLPLGKDSVPKVVEKLLRLGFFVSDSPHDPIAPNNSALVTFSVNRFLLNRFDTRSTFPEAGAQSRAAQPSRRDAELSGAPLTGWPEGRQSLREKRFSPMGW